MPRKTWTQTKLSINASCNNLTYAKNILPCQITDGTNEIKYTDPVNKREREKKCDIIVTLSEPECDIVSVEESKMEHSTMSPEKVTVTLQ